MVNSELIRTCSSRTHTEGRERNEGANKGDLSNPPAYRLVALHCPLLAEDVTVQGNLLPWLALIALINLFIRLTIDFWVEIDEALINSD